MNTDRAVRICMVMSGKYNTGNKIKVIGKDAWSNPIEEIVDEVDWARLETDLAEMKRLD